MSSTKQQDAQNPRTPENEDEDEQYQYNFESPRVSTLGRDRKDHDVT